VFIEAKDDGGGGDNWTTGAISRAISSQIITTNKPTPSFYTGRMPFLSPNQQCQSSEGKISHSMDLLTPS